MPEIAILYPEAKTADSKNLYSLSYPELTSLRGWIDLLGDSGVSSSVIYEYQLSEKLTSFPLLIVPATDKLSEGAAESICGYVENGGRVIIDRKSLKFFGEKMKISQKSCEERLVYLDSGSALAAAECEFSLLESESATPCAFAFEANIYRGQRLTAALCSSNDREGRAVALALDLGNVYNNNQSGTLRDFTRGLLSAVGFESIVSVEGESSDYVEVVLSEKNGGLRVNLLNTAGPHSQRNVRSYGQIPPLYGLTVKIRSGRAPRSVTSVPNDPALEWNYSDGIITAELKKLSIHTCIMIDY